MTESQKHIVGSGELGKCKPLFGSRCDFLVKMALKHGEEPEELFEKESEFELQGNGVLKDDKSFSWVCVALWEPQAIELLIDAGKEMNNRCPKQKLIQAETGEFSPQISQK